MILFNLKFINPNFNVAEIIYWKQHNTIGYATLMKSGSYVPPPALSPDAMSLIQHSPCALLNVMIMPDWNHIHNPFSLLAAFENLLILLAIILTAFFFRMPEISQRPLFYLSFFFVIFLFVLIGLTTPVIVSMVRYKAPALPFLIFILILMFDKEKFTRWLKG